MVTAPALRVFRNGQHPGDLLARLYDRRADYRPTSRGFSCTIRVSCHVLARGAHVRAAFAHGDAVCCIVVLFCQITDDPTSGVGKSRGPHAANSHPFGTLTWIAIVTAISLFALTAPVITRRTIAIWVASNVIAAAGFAPWAWLLLRRAVAINRAPEVFSWISYPSPEVVYSALTGMVGGRFMAAVLFAGVVLALLPARYAVGAEK